MPRTDDHPIRLYIADWKAQPGYRPGDDPDSFIRREGPGAFQAMIDSAQPAGVVAIAWHAEKYHSLEDPYDQQQILDRMIRLVRIEPELALKRLYVQAIADLFQIHPVAIAQLAYPPERGTQGRGGVDL